MNIPESAIRPFEPHGIPMFLIGEYLLRLLIEALATSIIANQLVGLFPHQVTNALLEDLEGDIIDELLDATLAGVGCGIELHKDHTGVVCSVNYFQKGNSRMQSIRLDIDFNL